jgi:hypothetical protein
MSQYQKVINIVTSLATSSILMGGITPVLAQYSCPSREVQTVDEVNGFKFEAQGCQRQGKKVICQAWITSLEKDVESMGYSREDSSWGKTRLIDLAGNEYVPELIQSGKDVEKSPYMYIRLTQNVPLKVSATFTSIPESIRDVALLEVSLYNSGSKLRGKLRNLKVTEAKAENNAMPAGSSTAAKPMPAKKKK